MLRLTIARRLNTLFVQQPMRGQCGIFRRSSQPYIFCPHKPADIVASKFSISFSNCEVRTFSTKNGNKNDHPEDSNSETGGSSTDKETIREELRARLRQQRVQSFQSDASLRKRNARRKQMLLQKPTVYFSCDSLMPQVEGLLSTMRKSEMAVYFTAVTSITGSFMMLYDVPIPFIAFGCFCGLFANRNVSKARQAISHDVLTRHVVTLGGVLNKKLTIEVESFNHGRITHILNLGKPVADDWADSKHAAGLRRIEEAKNVTENSKSSPQKNDTRKKSSKISTFKEDAIEKMARVQAQQADQLEGPTAWPVSRLFEIGHFSIAASNMRRADPDPTSETSGTGDRTIGLIHDKSGLISATKSNRSITHEQTLADGVLQTAAYVKAFNVAPSVPKYSNPELAMRQISTQVSAVNMGICVLMALGSVVMVAS